MILVTAEQMRECDRRTIEEVGLPGIVLMENAAQGAVRVLTEAVGGEVEGLDVAAFCGRGNNGGDGLAILRILANRGAVTTAYLFCKADELTGDAATNLAVALGSGVAVVEIDGDEAFEDNLGEMALHEVYVDALLGTGLNSEVKGRYRRAIELLNDLDSPVLAVDIPSGLSADTGAPLGVAVMADLTATFGLVKQGLALDGEGYAGELTQVDISIPPHVADDLEIGCRMLSGEVAAALLNPRPAMAHKGTFGHLLVLGGSTGKSGAPCLTAMGGLRAGAGLVTAALPADLNPVAEMKLTAVMTQPLPANSDGVLSVDGLGTILELMENKSVLALGPGLGGHVETVELVRGLAAKLDAPMVIDADGLNALAFEFGQKPLASSQVVLTPHPGEASRLLHTTTARIQADRLTAARDIARLGGAVCVLKGARTVIADPSGAAFICPTGNVLLAAGGSGDVLTGVIAGLMCQGLTALEAACAGAYVHGLAAGLAAAEFGLRGLAAEELVDYLPAAFASLEAPEAAEDEHEGHGH